MKLVVGLGNPGSEYENTRHNVGFEVLDYIAELNGYKFTLEKKFNALSTCININGEKVIIVKPLSFMNLSGNVVGKYAKYYDIMPEDILVIHDDLDMEFGKIRIVYDSSSGGHNGIKNIIENIGTKEFTRLKIGISNNKSIDTKDYVLGRFGKEDRNILNNTYEKVKDIINDFINYDCDKLKQIYNSKNNI